MKQNTDFNWSALIPFSSDLEGKFITVTVEADFANGEKAQTKRSFFYNPSKQAVTLNGNWSNLLGNAAH